MTSDVASVHPEMPVAKIASLLLDRRISAVPVVDDSDRLLGMVSEGDLIGRGEQDWRSRSDWWLALLAGQVEPEKLADMAARDRVAREVMSSPVVTVAEDTDLSEIAQLLAHYRIKRVPVVREDRVVGIVSRADLLRPLASASPAQTAAPQPGLFGRMINEVDEHFHHRRPPEAQPAAAPPQDRPNIEVAAAKFQELVAEHEQHEVQFHEALLRAAKERRLLQTEELAKSHLSDAAWCALLRKAAEAARQGETEFLMLRFPSQLCSDGGRAVNLPESSWPDTLRGEAAEVYLRWELEIKPHGFNLTARVLDYPDGMPGDIGLFLSWRKPTS
jgi:CBS domain-containing protein